jgi:hypothetical protein
MTIRLTFPERAGVMPARLLDGAAQQGARPFPPAYTAWADVRRNLPARSCAPGIPRQNKRTAPTAAGGVCSTQRADGVRGFSRVIETDLVRGAGRRRFLGWAVRQGQRRPELPRGGRTMGIGAMIARAALRAGLRLKEPKFMGSGRGCE